MSDHTIELTVNGRRFTERVEARVTLGDFLREQLGYTGTHLPASTGSAAPAPSGSTASPCARA